MNQPTSEAASRVAHLDIFSRILPYCDDATLSRCMRLSWVHFDICGKLLYQRITIDPEVADNILHGASAGPIILYDGSERELKRSLFQFVEEVDIVNHHICDTTQTACKRWKSIGITFPSLKVLRIWVVNDGQHYGWHSCPWVTSFKPVKLVLRGVKALSVFTPYSCVPRSLHPLIQRLTIVIEQMDDLTHANLDCLRSRSRTMIVPVHRRLETTVIFRTDKPEQHWPMGSEGTHLVGFRNIVDQLAILALAPISRLSICDTGQFHPDFFARPLVGYDSVQDHVEDCVRKRVEEITIRRAEDRLLASRLDQLRFSQSGDVHSAENQQEEDGNGAEPPSGVCSVISLSRATISVK